MSEKDDGGFAFPGSADTEPGHMMRQYGMTLRLFSLRVTYGLAQGFFGSVGLTSDVDSMVW